MNRRFPFLQSATVAASVLILLAGACGEVKIEKNVEGAAPGSETGPGSEPRLKGKRVLAGPGDLRQPRFLPQKGGYAWLGRSEPEGPFEIWTLTAPADEPHCRRPDLPSIHGFDVLPGGDGLVVACGPASPAPEPDSPPTLAQGVLGWLFDRNLDLFRLDDPPSELEPLLVRPGHDGDPAIGPDGQKVVFTSLSPEGGSIWVQRISGGHPYRLLDWPGAVQGPRFSPDGSSLVFAGADPDGSADLALFLCRADGEQVRRLVTAGRVCFTATWHPDGKSILFSSNAQDQDFELYRIRPDGSGLERVTHAAGLDAYPGFSTDGKQLIWISGSQGTGPQARVVLANWIP